MANCSKCGKSVGCGCQLINGLCSTCHSTSVQPKPVTTTIKTKIR